VKLELVADQLHLNNLQRNHFLTSLRIAF
jgi:hypothetical protein